MKRCSSRMRLGTFNVNGKFPSQDLSVWVQGNHHLEVDVEAKAEEKPSEAPPVATAGYPSIPKLKNISPLSLGEIIRNPFDWSMYTSILSSVSSDLMSTTSPSCTQSRRRCYNSLRGRKGDGTSELCCQTCRPVRPGPGYVRFGIPRIGPLSGGFDIFHGHCEGRCLVRGCLCCFRGESRSVQKGLSMFSSVKSWLGSSC